MPAFARFIASVLMVIGVVAIGFGLIRFFGASGPRTDLAAGHLSAAWLVGSGMGCIALATVIGMLNAILTGLQNLDYRLKVIDEHFVRQRDKA